MPCANMDAQMIANRAISSYCISALVVRDLLKKSNSILNLEHLLKWMELNFEQYSVQVSFWSKKQIEDLIHEDTKYFDNALRDFMIQMFEAYQDKFSFDKNMGLDQMYYMKNIMPKALSQLTGETPKHHLRESILKVS